MVITKQDVKKQLAFESRGTGVRCTPTTRVLRTQAHQKKGRDVVDLSKMSSGSFMNLIGEGPSSSAVSSNENLKRTQKAEDELKIQMMLNLNNGIIGADGVQLTESEDERSDKNVEKICEDDKKQSDTPIIDNNITNALADKVNSAEEPQNKPVSGQKPKEIKEQSQKIVTVSNVVTPNSPLEKKSESDNGIDMGGIHDTSILDATLPLFVESKSQTDDCHILCTCAKCKGLVKSFFLLLNRGYSEECENTHNKPSVNDSNSFLHSSHQEEDQFIPLFKGCPTKISVTCKGKLKILDKNPKATDRDYIYTIMDDLFEPNEMANMTAAGRTKGSTKMDPKIKDSILVYLQNKFDGVDETTLNLGINAKCYCARRQLWEKKPDAVRKKMPKNVKKIIGENSENTNTEKPTKVTKKSNKSSQEDRKIKRVGDKVSDSMKKTFKERSPKSQSKKHDRHHKRHEIKIPYSPHRSPFKGINSSPAGKFKRKSSADHPRLGNKCPKKVQDILAINTKLQKDFEKSPTTKKIHVEKSEASRKKQVLNTRESKTVDLLKKGIVSSTPKSQKRSLDDTGEKAAEETRTPKKIRKTKAHSDQDMDSEEEISSKYDKQRHEDEDENEYEDEDIDEKDNSSSENGSVIVESEDGSVSDISE